MSKQVALVVGPAVIPAKAGIQYAAACRLIIGSSAILDRPPSRAMTRRVTFACARNEQTSRVSRRPRRHTRESGYPVRRGLSIDHRLLCNTGSPAFAGDDTARDIRSARMRKRFPFVAAITAIGQTHTCAFSRRECARVVRQSFAQEGRGECRALDAP